MTIFDLLFIALFLTGVGTLAVAGVSALRGRRAAAWSILQKLAFLALAYIAIVYAVTAFSTQPVLRIGEPQCSDDWYIAVESAKRTSRNSIAVYDITLRVFSRARRVAQRELAAKDVYLINSQWQRYDPRPTGSEVPLNTLLQPGESITTSRRFELPVDEHSIGLMLDRKGVLPICVIIGECGAFHRAAIVHID
jgi:hypothetical protein